MTSGISAERTTTELFAEAGIRINGSDPWDPKVQNSAFYSRVISQGSLGLGESYMDGDWTCASLDKFFDRVISAGLSGKVRFTPSRALLFLQARIRNLQTVKRSVQAAEVHYDLPIDIFEATFDSRLTGSCAYWKDALTLDDAQSAKLDLVSER